MTTRLEIRLSPNEGALIRTLGLIQRRGFSVESMDLRAAGSGQRLRLKLADSPRCPGVLARQLERLHDVEHVRRLDVAGAGRRAGRRVGIRRALAGLFQPRPRVAAGGV